MINCLNCSKPFEPPLDRSRYCSRPCYMNHQYGPEGTKRRVMSRIEQRGEQDCWLWTGRCDPSGYGRYAKAGPNVYPHRMAWRWANGEIPPGMDVCHHCDVRNCCNPKHMFLGTQVDNNLDKLAKRRHAHGETNSHAILTDELALEIRREYRCQRTNGKVWASNAKELAAKYGISDRTLIACVSGRTWKHLPMRAGDGEEA